MCTVCDDVAGSWTPAETWTCQDASERRCQGNGISDAVTRRKELCELLIDADVAGS